MYAVIELQWHQYMVKAWDKIVVDRLEANDKFVVENVIAIFDESGLKSLWTPYVKGAKVNCKVEMHGKWEKIHVMKFKRKNRYSRKIWFRPYQTTLIIEDIVS